MICGAHCEHGSCEYSGYSGVENCSNTRIVEFSYNCCCLLDYQIEVSRGIDGGWRSSQRMVDSDLQIRAFLSVRASVLV